MKMNRNSLLIVGIAALLIAVFVIWSPFSQDAETAGPDSEGRAFLSESGTVKSVSSIPRSNDWNELDNPIRDGWESEALHELIKKRLAVLSELVASDEFDQDLLGNIVDPAIGG